MSNMSYCMWQNTRLDFNDAVNHFNDEENGKIENMDEEEATAMKQLMRDAYDFLNDYGHLIKIDMTGAEEYD